MAAPLPRVFSPGAIGSLQIKNRIVLPPMLMGYGSEDGYVTERAKDYYAARARGGTGLVIVEAAMAQPAGRCSRYYLDASDDRYTTGLAKLAEVIKAEGARAAIQLGDGGRETRPEVTGRRPIGPSPVAARKREVPIEMSQDDIKNTIGNFANATLRAKQAGYEGVEIHAAHVYLLEQFLSRSTNFRADKYGGSVANRFRILAEIADATRGLVGRDFPFWLRINGREYDIEGGLTLEETKEISQLAEAAGYDAVSVSAGSPHYDATMQSMYSDPGSIVPLASAIKESVRVPVIAVGGLNPQLGEEVLSRGEADFICIGRGLMTDPDLPNKILEGRDDDVVPCVYELDCVNRGVLRDTPIPCLTNPALGREREYEIRPAEQPRTVVVVGGGPAGLETAKVAAQRGHRVVVFERDQELGGTLRIASKAPRKETYVPFIDYYARQLRKHKVDVRLGEEATASAVLAVSPDVVILATGASCNGHGRSSRAGVATVDHLLLNGRREARSAVIMGGTTRCCELADLLSEAGVQTTVAGPDRKLAPELVGIVRGLLLKRLADKKVVMLTETRLEVITPTGVGVIRGDGSLEEIEADTVAFSHDASLDLELLGTLREAVPEVYCIGDALQRREPIDAVADGARVGRRV